jgi:GTP-binding protein HflX
MNEPRTLPEDEARNDDVVARVLNSAASTSAGFTLFGANRAAALQDESTARYSDPNGDNHDGDQFDRSDRQALRRVAGLSTELEDVTEVEYRQLRLENVVLIGVYSQGTLGDAENSMRCCSDARTPTRAPTSAAVRPRSCAASCRRSAPIR